MRKAVIVIAVVLIQCFAASGQSKDKLEGRYEPRPRQRRGDRARGGDLRAC